MCLTSHFGSPIYRRDISAYLMPKDWLETLEAVRLTNADLLRRYACLSTHCCWKKRCDCRVHA